MKTTVQLVQIGAVEPLADEPVSDGQKERPTARTAGNEALYGRTTEGGGSIVAPFSQRLLGGGGAFARAPFPSSGAVLYTTTQQGRRRMSRKRRNCVTPAQMWISAETRAGQNQAVPKITGGVRGVNG